MDEKANPSGVALTEEQRRLARDNIGLVAVHLRRFVFNLARPQRDREWEDLFQEGCIGLIRAAGSYRPERGIAFAAYALPRIHNAVSRALRERFSTVRVPETRSGHKVTGGDAEAVDDSQPPRAYSFSVELEDRVVDRRRKNPSPEGPGLGEKPPGETVGGRLRDKYDRAVHQAGDAIATRASARGDRDELIRVLTEERFLVPDEESRRALRQIARDTRSSYARVAQCEKRLAEAIRQTLEADPEFRRLESWARTGPVGVDLPIDETLEGELAAASAHEFLRRYRRAGSSERAAMLARLVEASHQGLEKLVLSRVSSLSPPARERLLGGVQSPKRR